MHLKYYSKTRTEERQRKGGHDTWKGSSSSNLKIWYIGECDSKQEEKNKRTCLCAVYVFVQARVLRTAMHGLLEGSKLTAMFGCNYTVQGLIMYGEAWFGL